MDISRKFVLTMEELENFKFPKDEFFALEVNYNQVKYEFLLRLSSKNKNMICMGSGAYDRAKENITPPIFRRHSWQKEFEESVLYYNDPTLYHDFDMQLGWCVGKNDEWYLSNIKDIILILVGKNGVQPENMLFFGSSGGGFTAIILATLIRNSAVIVNNPQIFLERYVPKHFNKMVEVCFDETNLEIVLSRYGSRFDVVEVFKNEKYMPPMTYIVNMNSPDIPQQLIPFISSLTSFEHFNDQLKILFYKDEKGHVGIFDTLKTIEILKDHFKVESEETVKTSKTDKLKSLLKMFKKDTN